MTREEEEIEKERAKKMNEKEEKAEK
jgi:hypothetical protein